jgi:hypothetical protein
VETIETALRPSRKVLWFIKLTAEICSLIALPVYAWDFIFKGIHPNPDSWLAWQFPPLLAIFIIDWKYLDSSARISKVLARLITTISIIFLGIKMAGLAAFHLNFIALIGVVGIIGSIFISKGYKIAGATLFSLAMIGGFIPTAAGLLGRSGTEPLFPWIAWSVSHVLYASRYLFDPNAKIAQAINPIAMAIGSIVIVYLVIFL